VAHDNQAREQDDAGPTADSEPRSSGERVRLNVPGQNRLLTVLPADVRNAVLAAARREALAFKQTLIRPNEPITHAWFPLGGVCSVLTDAPGVGPVEITTIGNEGMVGVTLLLGTDRTPATHLCQVPGEALVVPAAAFAELADRFEALRRLLLRYAQSLFNLAAQSAACNRVHNIEERTARWLLMTRDRVSGDEFPLTHEFLAQMLGVRRAGVTVAMGMLQKAGLITYARGVVRVVDPAGLHAASCDCYDVARRDAERLRQ
jgi:CRP-like cAMP-binding protein